MDDGDRTRRGSLFPYLPAALALSVDVALPFLPLLPSGDSRFCILVLEDSSIEFQLANAVSLFATAVVILIGLVALARGHAPVASGVFVAAATLLTLRIASYAIASIGDWPWETTGYLGLQAAEVVLLAAAALAAFPAKDARRRD